LDAQFDPAMLVHDKRYALTFGGHIIETGTTLTDTPSPEPTRGDPD
jgi:hypothetical protein